MTTWVLGDPETVIGEFRFTVSAPYITLDEGGSGALKYRWNRYRVDVVVESPRDAHTYGEIYNCGYTGSAVDCEKSIVPDEREVVECVIREIMEAYTDPVEFMQMAFMEPPKDVWYIKTIYDLLMYADGYGKALEDLLPGDWWEEGEIASRITEVSE